MSDHLPTSPVPVSPMRFNGTSANYIYAGDWQTLSHQVSADRLLNATKGVR